jgi:rhamnogalacturonyl hydrolase YesR
MKTNRLLKSLCIVTVSTLFGFGANCGAQTAAPAAAPTPATPAPATPAAPSAALTSALSSAPNPKPEEIKTSLDAILVRLDAANKPQFIDKTTKAPVTDLSQLGANDALDTGEKGNYRPLIYPYGVIHQGMLLTTSVTGDPKFAAFTAKWFQFFADTMPKFDKLTGMQNPYQPFLTPMSLDNCGAMGAALIKARQAKVGADMIDTINREAKWISTGQLRLDDGTVARTAPVRNSVWADDMYMCVPFLAQMGKLTGDTKYYDDAIKQVTGISSKLFVPTIGLYTHGWNSQGQFGHDLYWGRANGWCMMAMAELLDVLPENYPGRDKVLKQFQDEAAGLAAVQSPVGLWHQMLDKPDSFTETSSSAMFTFAIARGVTRGWLDATKFAPVAKLGWAGLKTKINDSGHVDSTCVGTNYGIGPEVYLNQKHGDDIHGYGPVLLAGAQMIEFAKAQDAKPNQ